MHCFPGFKVKCSIQPFQGYGLTNFTHQETSRSTVDRVVERVMIKVLQVKITTQLMVDPTQKVHIKCPRYTLTIIVCSFNYFRIFHQVHSKN